MVSRSLYLLDTGLLPGTLASTMEGPPKEALPLLSPRAEFNLQSLQLALLLLYAQWPDASVLPRKQEALSRVISQFLNAQLT